MINQLIYVSIPWILFGFWLILLILDSSEYSDETRNQIIRFAKYFAKTQRKIIKYITEVVIMFTYTIKGIIKDCNRLVDKGAIRVINILDMLRGDYDYGQEKK